MIQINILLIALICTIVTDRTDFFQHIEKAIYKLLHPSRQPRELHWKLLRCSLCQTFWCSTIYLIISNNISLFWIAYSLVVAFMTPVIGELVDYLRDILFKFFEIMRKLTQL